MLQEAIEALRQKDRARARDLLTRLLKAEQNNATYWVWMSAAVDSQKERLYCLQTALKLEPGNAAARRGLTMLGALPPDDSLPPFPLDRPRRWEEKLAVQEEDKPKKTGWANPLVCLLLVIAAGAILIALVLLGLMLPRGAILRVLKTPTHRPTATVSLTPSSTPLFRTPTPTFAAPTPLWMLFTGHVHTHAVVRHDAASGNQFGRIQSGYSIFQAGRLPERHQPDAAGAGHRAGRHGCVLLHRRVLSFHGR
ncbi:MAG: hypothetical protein Q8M58_11585 [Anaerolineales bacterium]|nr:hypothetical protein [Anaerolineales bacterium]